MSYTVKEYKNDEGHKRASVFIGRHEVISNATPPVAYKAAEGMNIVDERKQSMRR